MIQRKVCLVGDFAVGKTSLFERFVYNRFSENYLSTVGVRIQRIVVYPRGQELALVLWDTNGTRDSSALITSYLVGAAGAIIVGDVTRVATILHAERHAIQLRQTNPHTRLLFALNKCDLVAPDHAHIAVARQVANVSQVPLFLTSARSGNGVAGMFLSLGEELLNALAAR